MLWLLTIPYRFVDRDMFMRYRGGGIGHSVNSGEGRPIAHTSAVAEEGAGSFHDTDAQVLDSLVATTTSDSIAQEAGDDPQPNHTNPTAGFPEPGDDDGGEAPPEGDPEVIADEAEEYGYEESPDAVDVDEELEGEGEGEMDDDELGPEDGEGDDDDDAFGVEGFAPY